MFLCLFLPPSLPLVHPSFSLISLTFSSIPSSFSLTGSVPLVSFSVKNGFTALEVAQASDESEVWDEKEYDSDTDEVRIVRHDIEGVVKLLSEYIEASSTLRSHPVSAYTLCGVWP